MAQYFIQLCVPTPKQPALRFISVITLGGLGVGSGHLGLN